MRCTHDGSLWTAETLISSVSFEIWSSEDADRGAGKNSVRVEPIIVRGDRTKIKAKRGSVRQTQQTRRTTFCATIAWNDCKWSDLLYRILFFG